jgi:molybdenum-dependent DNA-binding transcriptional regulator ModE
MQMLLESLKSRISDVETKLTQQGLEVARLYKILAHLVEALMAESEDARRKALTEALKALEEGD